MKTGRPLVSCIMPTRNRRDFVPLALRYFLQQDYPFKELLIVDDGEDKIADLVPPNRSVRYIYLDKPRSIGVKRNIAIDSCKGGLILHWDDDDWFAPNRISLQVQALLDSRQDRDVCGLDRLIFLDILQQRSWLYVCPGNVSKPWLAGGTLCYKKEFWQKKKFDDLTYGEDTQFLWGRQDIKLFPIQDFTFYVGLIHPANTIAKDVTSDCWRSYSLHHCRKILGKDYRSYHIEGLRTKPRENRVKKQPITTRVKEVYRQMKPIPDSDKSPVTISLPCFQCKKYIRRAVESILAQTHTNLTLVVVNDGDKDPPWDELAHIHDPRLVRFDLKSNRGRYFADAVVLQAASDPYFLIQDADDWSEPDRIERLLKTINMTHADFVISACRIYKLIDSRLLPEQVLTYPRLKKSVSDIFEFRSDHHGLFRTDTLKEIGGYYGGYRIGYDTFIINILSLIGKVAYIDKPLYNRLIRPDSLTTSTVTGMKSTGRGIVRKQLGDQYREAFEFYKNYRYGRINRETFLERIRDICRCQLSPEENREIMHYTDELRGLLNIARGTAYE